MNKLTHQDPEVQELCNVAIDVLDKFHASVAAKTKWSDDRISDVIVYAEKQTPYAISSFVLHHKDEKYQCNFCSNANNKTQNLVSITHIGVEYITTDRKAIQHITVTEREPKLIGNSYVMVDASIDVIYKKFLSEEDVNRIIREYRNVIDLTQTHLANTVRVAKDFTI